MTDLVIANLCLTTAAYAAIIRLLLARRKMRKALQVRPTWEQVARIAGRERTRQEFHYAYENWPQVNGVRVPPESINAQS